MEQLQNSVIEYQYAQVTLDGEYWGLINTSGEYVIQPRYLTIHRWSERRLRLIRKTSQVTQENDSWVNRYNGQVDYANDSGELINPEPYDYGLDFSEGMAAVVVNGKWGFIDLFGEVRIVFNFQKTYSFQEGLCAAQHQDKWGFIDSAGDWVIEPQYNSVQSFSHGLAIVEENGDFLVVDQNNTALVKSPQGYPWLAVKFDRIILYGTTSQEIGFRHYGFMNIKGEILTQPIFYVESEYQFDLFEYADGMLIVTDEDEKYGYLNMKGQLAIACRYDDAKPFKNGIAQVALDQHQYYINKRGEVIEQIEVSQFPFDEVLEFSEGLAATRRGEYWGFIDVEGKVVVDFKYHECPPHKEDLSEGLYLAQLFPEFSCGLLPIIKSDGHQYQSGFIDKTGKEVISFMFLLVQGFEECR